MGIHADDARDQEEDWHDMKMDHKAGLCDPDRCPYCNKHFVPLFSFQHLDEDDEEDYYG